VNSHWFIRRIAFLLLLMLVACTADESQSGRAPSKQADLRAEEISSPLPAAGDNRYIKVLSDKYGVCVKTRFWQQRWQTNTYHDHSSASLRLPAYPGSSDPELAIGIGRLDTSEYKLRFDRKTTSGADINIAMDGQITSLVIDLTAANPDDKIVISFNTSSAEEKSAAFEIADGIMACKIVPQ
jgi:hypothetical protein